MQKVFHWAVIVSVLFTLVAPELSWARRIVLSPEQKELLQTAQNVFVHVIALTEKGQADAKSIQDIVSVQLQNIGFTTVLSKADPHDVLLKIKCEERKSWVSMSKGGGDADRPGAPSRLWKGPACQLTYFVDTQVGPWRREIRTDFEAPWKSAQANGQQESGLYALNHLGQALQKSAYPLELLAEWKQSDRLAKILTSQKTDTMTKLKVLDLAKQVTGPTMLHALQTAMTDPDLAQKATLALGHMGQPATPILLKLLNDSQPVTIKAAAAHALGEIGSHSSDSHILSQLLAMMESPDIDLQVQTEIVRAVGKIPDRRSIEPLNRLGLKAWTSSSNDPQIQELREAVDWSLWQINPSSHSEQ